MLKSGCISASDIDMLYSYISLSFIYVWHVQLIKKKKVKLLQSPSSLSRSVHLHTAICWATNWADSHWVFVASWWRDAGTKNVRVINPSVGLPSPYARLSKPILLLPLFPNRWLLLSDTTNLTDILPNIPLFNILSVRGTVGISRAVLCSPFKLCSSLWDIFNIYDYIYWKCQSLKYTYIN